jgi:hypothetical protein
MLYTLIYWWIDIKFSFDPWRSRERMLKLISRTWSWGPSPSPATSCSGAGAPNLWVVGSPTTHHHIRPSWHVNQGCPVCGTIHLERIRSPWCWSGGMPHDLAAVMHRYIRQYTVAGTTSRSSATSSPKVLPLCLLDRALAQDLYHQSPKVNPTSANSSWSRTLRSNNDVHREVKIQRAMVLKWWNAPRPRRCHAPLHQAVRRCRHRLQIECYFKPEGITSLSLRPSFGSRSLPPIP